jgi:hypothetical protein
MRALQATNPIGAPRGRVARFTGPLVCCCGTAAVPTRGYGEGVISDDELRAMSPEERLTLTRRIAAFGTVRTSRQGLRRRRRFVVIMTAASIGLMPWIAFLALELPHHYVASHWTLTWVGFDIAMLIGLATTALFAWRGRAAVIPAAVATGTLLACDAWFDVLTSDNAHDVLVAIGSAALLEIPLAVLLLRGARRILHLVVLQAFGSIHPRRGLLPPMHEDEDALDELTQQAETS